MSAAEREGADRGEAADLTAAMIRAGVDDADGVAQAVARVLDAFIPGWIDHRVEWAIARNENGLAAHDIAPELVKELNHRLSEAVASAIAESVAVRLNAKLLDERRVMLQTLMRMRFGPAAMTPEVIARIEAATMYEIERAEGRIFVKCDGPDDMLPPRRW